MKIKLIISVLALLILPTLAFATVNAQSFRTGETTTIGADEKIDSSAWLAGSSIDVAGTVNGDLYCAGQNITISGHIAGDVLCAGQTVTISGKIEGDVRAAGQTVLVGGTIAGSVTAAGQAVTVEGKSTIGRDASFVGQNITIHGLIGRDVVIGASSATVDATVGRNVTAQLENLTVSNDAKVNGTVNYTSPQKAIINSGAHIGGKTTYTELAEEKQTKTGYDFGSAMLWAVMLFFSGMLAVLLFPRVLHRTTNSAAKTPSRAIMAVLVGLIATVVTPVAIIMLMFTILGMPFALVALVAWLLILAVSGVFAAYYLGRVIWRSSTNAIGTMAAGALALVILSMIPIVNVLTCLLAAWFGSGVIILELKRHLAAPTYETKTLK